MILMLFLKTIQCNHIIRALLYTTDKVKERKRKAANKRPLFEGGTVLETYGDKRFKWNRSSKYKGAFSAWSKFAEIRKKLKAFV
jgi:hypothetical protein